MATIHTLESEIPTPSDEAAPLRVGILINSFLMPHWAYHILNEIQKVKGADLVVIVTTGDKTVKPVCSDQVAPRLLQFWRDLDRTFFCRRSAHHDAFEMVRFTPANGAAIISHCAQSENDRWSTDTLARLRAMQLDVLLNLSSTEPRRELQGIAKHGLWWFGDAEDLLTNLFWLLYEQEAVIENTLNISSSEFGTATLAGCYSAADRYSLFRNLTGTYWKRWAAVQRGLNEIRRDGRQPYWDGLVTLAASSHRTPGNGQCARLLIRLLGRMLRDRSMKFLECEEWFIAFRKMLATGRVMPGNSDFTLLRPPSGHFYADPFVIERDGKASIFFEDYSYASRKAVISFITIDSGGACSAPDLALEEDYHLAYPCLFEHNGEIYLLPETKNHGTIQLYRALDFPRRWELSHVLRERVSAVDSTLLQHSGKFWLFTSGLNSANPWFDGDSELLLFFADTLRGPWMAHPKNPIATDVRNCRGAGQIQKWNGQLIRPAQDCSTIYGHAVVLNHIDVLCESEYRETPVAIIGPDWLNHNLGTHTFNCSRSYEVVDGRRLVGRLLNNHHSVRFEKTTRVKPLFQRL